MNRYELFGYPLFFVVALEIFLGLILLRQNPRNSPVNKAVAVFAFASAGYALFSAIIYVRTSLGLPVDTYARANWIGWLSIPAALQSIFYMREEKSRTARIVGWTLYPFWGLMLILCLFTELVEPAGYSLQPKFDSAGPLENFARLAGALQILWVMYEVYRLRRQSSGTKRAQVNHFFYGTMIFGGGSALLAGFLQLFGGLGLHPELGAYFSFPWVVLTFYAISRYRLFDISLIISRLLTIVLLSIAVSVLHLSLFSVFQPVMGATNAILFSLFLIGTVFFGTHLSRAVQWRILSFLVKGRYDYQRVLKESIKATITILNLDELLHYLVDSINKSFDAESVHLFLKDSGGQYALRLRTGPGPGKNNSGHIVPAVVSAWLKRTGRVVIREDLEGLLPDHECGAIADYMRAIGGEVLIPLVYKGELQGFLALGLKGNREPYLQSDIDVLELLAGHAAIAIGNAQLYEEARRARGSMRESEAKFQTLAETAEVAIFIHQGGNFLYANRAAQVIGGYTVEEYLTMNFMSLVHPDFVDLVKSRARERLDGASQVPRQYEFKILRKNGEERWVLMTAGISEFDGKPAVIGTLIDITARKQAEEEREEYFRKLQEATHSLQESEEKFRSLAETAPAAIFIHQGGRFLYANAASVSMIGYTREEFLSMDFWGVTHPDDRETVIQRGRSRLVGDTTPDRYELRIVTKSGEVRWVDMTAGVIEYEGKPGIIGTAFDITDRKMAENERERYYRQLQAATQSLQESEEKFRTLAETTTAAIFIHQGQKLVYANAAAGVMTGYTSEELLQEDFWSLIHPDYHELVKERGLAGPAEKSRPDYEYKFIKKNGDECWVSMTAGFIEYGGKPAIIATLFDITDWKRAEEAKVEFYEESVRQYQERIEEEKRHRLEKEKILMDLHDGIGGITTNISILSELALKAKDRENTAKLLTTISQLSREGIAEIRGFMHSLDSKELNWRTLAVELRNQGTNMIKTHNIEFSIQTDISDAPDQPGSLTWVNVFKIYKEALTNVVKHSKASTVTVAFHVDQRGVHLSIRDNGTGVQQNGNGGRGLSNMKTRARDIGGEVSLLNDNGTLVSLELPLPLKYPV